MRRALADTLIELLESLLPARAEEAGVRVTDVVLDLPLEVRVAGSAADPSFLADAPRWRWTTDFDERPGRLRASFHFGNPV